jgi:hypothetical protein
MSVMENSPCRDWMMERRSAVVLAVSIMSSTSWADLEVYRSLGKHAYHAIF